MSYNALLNSEVISSDKAKTKAKLLCDARKSQQGQKKKLYILLH